MNEQEKPDNVEDLHPQPSEAAEAYEHADQADEHAAAPEESHAEQAADDVKALADEITRLKEENATMKDQALRALAEAENARRRAQKDREDATKFAITSFARDLLPVADNLRRAIDATPDELVGLDPRVQSLMDGIEATERELLRGLEKNGVERIEAEGKPFDPNMHEVMFEMPSGGQLAGTVMQVVENGYTLKGRILRPARVGVAADEGQGSTVHVDTQA